MGFLTPTNRPQRSFEVQSNAFVKSELSQEEWISSFLLKGALRTRLRSLPMLWMVIVSVVVFPIGFWNQMDSVSLADESGTTSPSPTVSQAQVPASGQTEVEQAVGSAATSNKETRNATPDSDSIPSGLPVLPNPNLDLRRDSGQSGNTRKMSVTVIVSGRVFKREISVPASGAKVKHAIAAMNLDLNEHDRVTPRATAPLYAGAKIRITRIRAEIKTRTVAVESNLRFRPSAALRPGQQKVEQSGQTGLIQVSERLWFKDGEFSGREAIGQKAVRAAQDKVVAVGARPYYMPGKIPYHNRYAKAYTLAARAGSPRDRVQSNESKTLRPVKSIILTATGYSPDPSENGGYTTTATGLPISYGAAAVDPRVIPLGTKMYVEGYGYAFACDTGGAIKGNRIDLAYDSYGVANSKGHKKVRVWILAP